MGQEKDPLSELGWLAYIAQEYGRKDVAEEIAKQIESARLKRTLDEEEIEEVYPLDTTGTSDDTSQSRDSQA